MAFVTGEPGSGKTELVREFIQRAMSMNRQLVAATGSCNAYGGAGDPYLPFREIMALLTGDIKARWQAGAIPRDHAERLWALMPHTLQALAQVGACLLDIFVASSALEERAALVSPAGGLKRRLAEARERGKHASVEQADLFDRYTQVLDRVVRRQPLILVLDDLQWADAGSITLLFHLGRRLPGQRILVIGIYRPNDVALGRQGERHPLEPLLHEFQRLFGDTEMDLDATKGECFVESVLDAEPNRFSADFRRALYRHTRGHALFTVEMLRGMQERGDLVQDEQGRWVEGGVVDWGTVPARVEGVIAERMARLPASLQETLSIASVEGELFTAEVVARVQGLEKDDIVRRLSRELGRRHHMVVSRDSQASWPVSRHGSQPARVSRYRFRHLLFHKFVYDQLDPAERTHLHEQVGRSLEEVYEGRSDEIAVHLARHFQIAAITEKAIDY